MGARDWIEESVDEAKASLLMELMREYKPELYEGLDEIGRRWDEEGLGWRREVIERVWQGLGKIAIDNAVAEPAAAQGRVAVVPATFGEWFVLDYGLVFMLCRLGRRG